MWTNRRLIGFATLSFALYFVGINAGAAGQSVSLATRFDVLDMAYLWPVPTTSADVDALISAETGTADGKSKIWPDDVFKLLIGAAQDTTVEDGVSSAGITFDPFADVFVKPSTWKLVGFRFDASAPGGHAGTTGRLGSTPQVRMIFQPVTISQGKVRIHDYTAHLAYSYITPSEDPRRGNPDKAAVRAVLADLSELKAASTAGGAPTEGPLRTHPGLERRVPGFAGKIAGFLSKSVQRGRLTDLAFMGIQPPEPWIFFAMRRRPLDGAFERVGPRALVGRQAQLLRFVGGEPVFPVPNSLNDAQDPPFTNRDSAGVSTAPLFQRNSQDRLLTPVFPGTPRPLLQDIPDIIANPERSNVLNTDCVSCHTESTRRRFLDINVTDNVFRYRTPSGISGVDQNHLPTDMPRDLWNVRNFGWFPRNGVTRATISQRTANEAAEAVELVNRDYLAGGSPQATTPAARAARQVVGRSTSIMDEPVARPLTLVMSIKPGETPILRQKVEKMQNLPAEQNPIVKALNRLGTVHFARFVFLNDRQLAVITAYDGSFEDYIDAFAREIGEVFDEILKHVVDAPPTPVSKAENRVPFLEYIRKNDLTALPPFYSAYPRLRVLDILTLQQKSGGG
jgi:hypothetical protein